jgi:hypothetical protein
LRQRQSCPNRIAWKALLSKEAVRQCRCSNATRRDPSVGATPSLPTSSRRNTSVGASSPDSGATRGGNGADEAALLIGESGTVDSANRAPLGATRLRHFLPCRGSSDEANTEFTWQRLQQMTSKPTQLVPVPDPLPDIRLIIDASFFVAYPTRDLRPHEGFPGSFQIRSSLLRR